MTKINILCVDDQREVLATLKKDLQKYQDDFGVETAESAVEAEEVINELLQKGEQVGLIICDHIMPGENGIEFLTRISADARLKHLKKILLTGLATHTDTIRAINQAKINVYTEKPWSDEELFTAIEELLMDFANEMGIETGHFSTLGH